MMSAARDPASPLAAGAAVGTETGAAVSKGTSSSSTVVDAAGAATGAGVAVRGADPVD